MGGRRDDERPAADSARRPWPDPVTGFLRSEAGSAVVLVGAVVAGLVWANSPWRAAYRSVFEHPLHVGSGRLEAHLTVRGWINDLLMAVFFFVVTLEIKREAVRGELSDRRSATVPIAAALGGMVVPAAIFLAFNAGTGQRGGWGVVVATDIAIAIGVLRLQGGRVPPSTRIFLLAVAIVDDLGAIAVIAVVYSVGLNVGLLLAWSALAAVLGVLGRRPWWHPAFLVVAAAPLWVLVHASGVHATIAGVALAAVTPLAPRRGPSAETIEEVVHPVSSYAVLPVFALANAGVVLDAGRIGSALSSRLGLGIVAALVVGKTVGIFGGASLADAGVRSIDRRQLLGVAQLGGIGFTVSIFVASLAFAGRPEEAQAKIAVLAGSLIAAVLGSLVLQVSGRPRTAE